MARPKGSGGSKKKTSELTAALDFIACAITENSEPWRASVQFRDGYMLAFNGVISAGVKTNDEFKACPHFGQLKRVLERAAEGSNFTQLDATKLAVTAGKFKAVIQCLDPAVMPPVSPDPNIAPADDRLRTGFETIGPIVKEAGTTVVEASLLLQGGTMVVCDRITMMEYWHGIDLPPGLVLPKAFINAVIAAKKKIVGFGFSAGQTVTLHFEDASWIKTQLFSEPWPESWANVLNRGDVSRCAPIPEGFFDAVAAVVPFSADGGIYFDATAIRSHEAPGQGASYDFNCPPGFSYSGPKLLLMKGRAQSIEFSSEHKCAFFFSADPPIRAALAARGRSSGQSIQPDSERPVPPQFQPPVQEPPQEAQGEPLAGVGDGSSGGDWNSAPALTPAPGEWGSEETGDPTDDGPAEDGFTGDPGDAWTQHAEPATDGGWKTTKAVPFPGS